MTTNRDLVRLRGEKFQACCLAFVTWVCVSQAAFAADPIGVTDRYRTEGLATAAEAQAQLNKKRAHQPPLDVRRKMAERFGDCLARTPGLHGKSVTFLISGEESDGQKLADSDCFLKGLETGHLSADIEGLFPLHVMRSLVANGLVRVDFHKQGPTDFSAVPPLALSPPASNGVSVSPTASIADQLGECAARVSPEAIRGLAQARVESDEELTAIRQLVPTFAQCLPPGVKLAFEPGALRDGSVLAYARLAFTQAASGTSWKRAH